MSAFGACPGTAGSSGLMMCTGWTCRMYLASDGKTGPTRAIPASTRPDWTPWVQGPALRRIWLQKNTTCFEIHSLTLQSKRQSAHNPLAALLRISTVRCCGPRPLEALSVERIRRNDRKSMKTKTWNAVAVSWIAADPGGSKRNTTGVMGPDSLVCLVCRRFRHASVGPLAL